MEKNDKLFGVLGHVSAQAKDQYFKKNLTTGENEAY